MLREDESMFFLGVDAGGTKTIAALTNRRGELLGIGLSGPCNILENGEETVRENLREAIASFKEILQENREKIYSCFGLPAVGEFRNSQDVMKEIVKRETGIEPNMVVNDVVVGWAAGTLTQDGVHVVAGTGAIIYGRKSNNEVRVSGWGSLIGDEGSAYDIGRRALSVITKQLDGRLPRSILSDLIMEKNELKDEIDLLEWVYKNPTTRRQKIASVAPLVYDAALKGDTFAKDILYNAAEELALAATTAARRLELMNPLFTYSGSVLENNKIVRERFCEILLDSFPTATIRRTSLPPVFGAILLSYKIALGRIDESFLEALKKASEKIEQSHQNQVYF